ncbi:hypothetical protein HYV86_00500 [Candidatus Woesearchaeota archaeon]|nr:hypothetical protein [Candidatus Woesearchaeota archaeon]
MKLICLCSESAYSLVKPIIFLLSKEDPYKAHEWFITNIRVLHTLHLDRLIFYYKSPSSKIELSNAAGFNKNGQIPPQTLKYIGFDRVVVGTVTADPWAGNPRPSIIRFPQTGSMVNWQGLPGVGAAKVAQNMAKFGAHGVPITINLMSTPGKKGEDLLNDLAFTIKTTRDLHGVDRFELNISCPNTHGSGGGMDARKEYQEQLVSMLQTVTKAKHPYQELDLKISPDLDDNGMKELIAVATQYPINRFTIANTTTRHDPNYIQPSPGKGGASGNAVYQQSLATQRLLVEHFSQANVIACGGINSIDKAKERISIGNVVGIQIYTPFIFEGPKLVRILKTEI